MFAPVTNIRAACRTSAVFSTSGPTIMPGVSHRNTSGMSNASQSCMNRASFDPDQRRHHPGAELPAYLEHRSGIGQSLDDRSDIVNAKSILGNDCAQQTLVGAFPVANLSLEIR